MRGKRGVLSYFFLPGGEGKVKGWLRHQKEKKGGLLPLEEEGVEKRGKKRIFSLQFSAKEEEVPASSAGRGEKGEGKKKRKRNYLTYP